MFNGGSREIMVYPVSTLVPLSSRTCSTLLVMTQHVLRIQHCAAAAQVAYFRTSDTRDSSYRIVNTKSSFVDRFIVYSIVLLTNGISFAIEVVLLLVVGVWGDYGHWR